MRIAVLKLFCLILALATVASTACGCQPAADSTASTSSDMPQSEVASTEVSSDTTSSDVSSDTTSSKVSSTSSAASTVSPKPAVKYDPERTYGNTDSNLNNHGFASIQGDWIYFGTSTGVYKTKTDQSKTVRLCDAVSGYYINVSGAWVYFVDSRTHQLYKVRTDGTDFQRFGDQKAYSLSVVSGYAFYTTASYSNSLYKTPVDKFEPTEIIKEDMSIFDPCVYEGRIYYRYYLDRYSTDLNGQNKICYGEGSSQGMFFYDGYIYTSGNLTKEKLDGSFKQKLVERGAMNVTAENGWLYYTDYYDNNKLYKIKTDGTSKQLVYDGYCDKLSVAGNWIYFYLGVNFDKDGKVVALKRYKIKTDGTKLQELI